MANKVKQLGIALILILIRLWHRLVTIMLMMGEILIVEDSFGRPFSAFMSLQFNKTDILDLRHYKIQSLTEFIKAVNMIIYSFIQSGIFSETGNDSIMFTFK